MRNLIMAMVCLLAVGDKGLCQELDDGSPITPGLLTASFVEVQSLTLTVNCVQNGVYKCSSQADFKTYCDLTAVVPMLCYSRLQVGEVGGRQDEIETPLGSWVNVPAGTRASWTFDNANPGPAPTFPGDPTATWRAFAIIVGTRIGIASISDTDIVLKDSNNQTE